MASDFFQAFWSVTVAAGTLEALSRFCTSTSSSTVQMFLTVALSKSLPFNVLSGANSWAFLQGVPFISLPRNHSPHGAWSGIEKKPCEWFAVLLLPDHGKPTMCRSWGTRGPRLPVQYCTSDSTWSPMGPGRLRHTQLYGKQNSSEGLCPNSFFCHLFIRFLFIKAGRMFSVPSYKRGY